MIRLMLAVMAGLLCGAAGMRKAGEIRRRGAALRRWEALLEHMQLLLEQGALPLPEVFRHAACEDAPQDALLRCLAEGMGREPLVPLTEHYAREALQGQEGEILRRMMEGLSSGTAQSRSLAVSQALREVKWLQGATGEKERLDARMWITLGWTCGACLTILLL